MSSRADITYDEVKRILEIVDQSDDVELQVEFDGFKLHVRKGSAGNGSSSLSDQHRSVEAETPRQELARKRTESAPAPETAKIEAPAAAPEPEKADADAPLPEGAVSIDAPMLGRFYRASSPSNPPFVEIGQKIAAGDTVGVIEVMKLFNEIKSSVSGTVIEIRVENGGMVEESDVLFAVQPD